MPRVAVHYWCTPRPFVLHVDTQEEAERLAERFRAYAGVRAVSQGGRAATYLSEWCPFGDSLLRAAGRRDHPAMQARP